MEIGQKDKRQLTIFDFDGTLTSRDTLLLFIRFACGWRAFMWGMLLYAPLLVLMKLRLYHNGKTKEKVLSHFFKGWKVEDFKNTCQRFAGTYRHILRPESVKILRQAQQDGARVLIVSASVDYWVQPFFPDIEVIGTRLEEQGTKGESRLTGRFLTPNCYGEEKVRRVKEIIDDSNSYHIIAYGDSRGDREMLAWADEGIYIN